MKDKQDKKIYNNKESFLSKNNIDSLNKIFIEKDNFINKKKIK